MKKIRSFFWLCSGSNKKLLEESPTDHSKYAGIGATIFFTGLLAAISAAYAIYFVFENITYSILFGIVWGAMIFNLDRFIVSSMRKKGSKSHEWAMATPRLILAMIIAIVISKPLELKIFEKEIEGELTIMTMERVQEQQAKIDEKYGPELDRLRAENRFLEAAMVEKSALRDTLAMIAQKEADGTGGTMRRNAGPIYKIKKADADQAQNELDALTALNNRLIAENLDKITQIEEKAGMELSQVDQDRMDGLAGRLDALDRLTRKSEAIWLANWFIILLFIAVETAPVFVKIISEKGPYDYLLEKEEHGFLAQNKAEISKINTETKEEAEGLLNPEKDFLIDELGNSLNQYKG